MKEKRNFIIRWNDLSYEKQQDILKSILNNLEIDPETQEYLAEMCGSDPFDFGRANGDAMTDHINGCIERACEKSWADWEVEYEI